MYAPPPMKKQPDRMQMLRDQLDADSALGKAPQRLPTMGGQPQMGHAQRLGQPQQMQAPGQQQQQALTGGPGRPPLQQPPLSIANQPMRAQMPANLGEPQTYTPPQLAQPDPTREQAFATAKAESKAQTQANGPLSDADTSTQDVDTAAEQALLDAIKGASNVDTSEEEKFIQDLMTKNQNQSLRQNAAAMGAAGFGMSGADVAMGGDIMRNANESAAGQIMDLRRDAKQQAFENAAQAIGLDIDKMDAASQQEFMDYLMDIAAQEAEGPPGAPDPHDAADFDESDWLDPAGGGDMNERTLDGISGVDRYIGSDDTYDYWIGVTGQKFVVRHHGNPHGGG